MTPDCIEETISNWSDQDSVCSCAGPSFATDKGVVEIGQISANPYVYCLTQKRGTEESRPPAEYLHSSLAYHRRAGRLIIICLHAIGGSARCRVLLAGISQLAEVASVDRREVSLKTIGTVGLATTIDHLLDGPV